MAIGSAVAASLGTLFLIKKLRVSDATKLILNRFAPFIGVASANEVNLFFSRIQDFSKGIKVYDPETKEELPETSIVAAKQAFM
jgi:hypothetical protein